MEIVINQSHTPFHHQPKRLSFYEREEVDKIVTDLLDRGIIQPSTSPYSSRIVLVRKTKGLRLCVDYRDLNKLTERDNFPVPNMDEQIERLRDKHYFTRLDLKNAFHHVPLVEDSMKLTAFTVPSGHYEYRKMPFGLKNSPATFMRFINSVFKDLINSGKITVYIDDIVIATFDKDENLEILAEVLKLMSKCDLELRLDKSIFLTTEIEYLGYVIGGNKIKPNKDNLQAVAKFPVPKTFKELQSFL